MYRVARWLGWTVILSLVPFIGLLGLRAFVVEGWPGLSPLVGSGQLLLTCVALVAGSVKELSAMSVTLRSRSRDGMVLACLIFVAFLCLAYGYLANDLINGTAIPAQKQQTVSLFSIVCLLMCIVIGSVCMVISDPDRR